MSCKKTKLFKLSRPISVMKIMDIKYNTLVKYIYGRVMNNTIKTDTLEVFFKGMFYLKFNGSNTNLVFKNTGLKRYYYQEFIYTLNEEEITFEEFDEYINNFMNVCKIHQLINYNVKCFENLHKN